MAAGDNNSPNNVQALRVHLQSSSNGNTDSSKFVLLSEQTTARECVMMALREFSLHTSKCSLHFALYQVSLSPVLSGNETVFVVKSRRLPDGATKLWDSAPLHCKFVLRDTTDTGSEGNQSQQQSNAQIEAELLKQVPWPLTLQSVSLQALAAELTHQDWLTFSAIEPQQVLQSVVNAAKDTTGAVRNYNAADTQSTNSDLVNNEDGLAELHAFESLSERQMFWTINEILDANPMKRANTVKCFVRLAKLLLRMRNYNAAFAVLSGIDHATVKRLRTTVWERLPAKTIKVYEELWSLLDPSRNMAKYRHLIAATGTHPYLPFYPVNKKDLTFLALATPTVIEGLTNFDKFRSLAREIRHLLASATDRGAPINAVARYPYGFAFTSTSSTNSGSLPNLSAGQSSSGGVTEHSSAKKIFAQQLARKKANHYLKAALKVGGMRGMKTSTLIAFAFLL